MKLKMEGLIKPQQLMISHKNRENLRRVAKFLMVMMVGGNERLYNSYEGKINTNERENNYED